jgi:hypothetical protein
MTDTLARAVHAALKDFFEAAPPWHELARLRALPEPRRGERPWRRPLVAAIAAGSVAAGAAGVVLVTGDRGTSPASSQTTTVAATTTTPPSEGLPGNPGLRPTELPEDLRIAQVMLPPAGYEAPERPSEGVVWIVIGRRDASGAIDVGIRVSVDYGRMFAPPVGSQSQWTREPITIDGIPGEFVRDDVNGMTIVEYQVGEQVVMVESDDAGDQDVLDAMIAIAGSIAVDEATAELRGDLPSGYEVLAQATEPPNDIATMLWYSDGTNVRAIEVLFNVAPPDDFQYWFMDDGLTETTVRGKPAFITQHDPPAGTPYATPGVSVMWLEREGLLVTVSGHDITEEEVIAAAESLRPMTDAEFVALQEQARDTATSETTAVVTTG